MITEFPDHTKKAVPCNIIDIYIGYYPVYVRVKNRNVRDKKHSEQKPFGKITIRSPFGAKTVRNNDTPEYRPAPYKMCSVKKSKGH